MSAWRQTNRDGWDERVAIQVRDGAVGRVPEGTPALPLMYSLRAAHAR